MISPDEKMRTKTRFSSNTNAAIPNSIQKVPVPRLMMRGLLAEQEGAGSSIVSGSSRQWWSFYSESSHPLPMDLPGSPGGPLRDLFAPSPSRRCRIWMTRLADVGGLGRRAERRLTAGRLCRCLRDGVRVKLIRSFRGAN